jgi:transcriptional antiterminator RfaH
MPLLPQETALSPEDLLDRPAAADPQGEKWWVLHTRPRTEKMLARQCVAAGLAFYLPLYHHEWRRSGRRYGSHLPLFPSYLFLRGDGEARLHAVETNLVVRCLPVVDQARLHDDLARVHRLIMAGAPLAPETRLRAGSRVEITGGPFAGMRGKVIRQGKKLTFVVEVQFLQQGVSVEVDSWMIQPLEPGPAEPGELVSGSAR